MPTFIDRQLPDSKYCRKLADPSSIQDCQVQLTGFNLIRQDAQFKCQINAKAKTMESVIIKSSSDSDLDMAQAERRNLEAQRTKDEYNWTQVSLRPGELKTEDEPFQVVWRRLSFEVKVSNCHNLLGGALERARNIWPFGGPRGGIGGYNDKRVPSSDQPTALSSVASSVDQLSSAAELASRQYATGGGGGQKRCIFENLNGFINSGEISAILGPSGAGKTSLLNAICGRTENYRGSVQLVGGGKRRMRLSIIPQKDYLIESLTVQENLLYSSKILNTNRAFNHEANADRVAKMLNLTSCLQSRAAKISGGEYKRVSIAQELLKQPDILILDEPTSGLDSLNCKKLIQSLGQLIEASKLGAIKPIAIVMTIHQPDIEVFQMFHHVYCMARKGRIIFDGKPADALRILQEQVGPLLGDRLLPANVGATNPANLLIEIASEDIYGPEPIERLASYQRKQFESLQGNLLLSIAGNQNLAQELTGSNKTLEPSLLASLASHTNVKSFTASSDSSATNTMNNKPAHLVRDKRLQAKFDHSGQFWHHTNLLAKRAFLSTIRDPLMTFNSLIFHLMIPFVMWTVYSRETTGSVKACPVIQREMDIISLASNATLSRMSDLQEQLIGSLECSTMFFLTTYSFSMCSLSMAALAFPLSMHVLLKEVRNGWYSLPSFVLAKTLANFPFEVIFPVISLVMIYLMLAMPSSEFEWRLWAIALVMALVAMISHTQGLIFGALCMDSVQSAIFLASASSLPLTLLSGFTARIKHMPLLLQRLSWFSLYRYSSDAINIIRFGFGICPCDQTTNDYLRTKEPNFSDIPYNMKPLFTYYLSTSGPEYDATQVSNVTTSGSTVIGNMSTSLARSNLANIPGLSQDFSLSAEARSELVKKLESNEIDLFARMADLMARSFTYGREVRDCNSVRSQLLTTVGAPKDEFLPMLFAGMLALLVAAKIILFVIVKFKIGSRI